MVRKSAKLATAQDTTVTEATATPVEATVVQEPTAKPVRYAPKSVLTPNARIAYVAANGKKGKSRDRFALYTVGMTVGEYIAAVKERNWSYGREDIRWDVQHGLIALEAPAAE
jgi:hypothetical protein